MRYTHLGRTGLKVSRICLGTMNFGPETDEPTSFAIMDQALEAGINFFDTANVYGLEGAGRDRADRRPLVRPGRRAPREDRAGHQALRRHGGLAQRGPALGAQHPPGLRGEPAAPADRLHRPLPDAPRRPGHRRGTRSGRPWRCCVHQGKILYVGSSNFAGWHIAQAQEAAARRNFLGLVSEQSIYNLIVRDIEPRCSRRPTTTGSGVIPWSPLQGGLLGGVVRKERDGSRRYAGRAAETIEARRPQLEAYEDLCAEAGEDPGTVGLAWLLTRRGGDRPHRRAPGRPSTSTRRCGRWRSRWTTRCSSGSTRSSRATRRPRRTTPGERNTARQAASPAIASRPVAAGVAQGQALAQVTFTSERSPSMTAWTAVRKR